MRNSLIILGCLMAGILGGASGLLPPLLLHPDAAMYVLYALLFLVGIEVGANPRVWGIIRSQNARILLVPLMMRELATLLAAPLMARHFGRLAPIVSGGATSMDTTLPIITKSVGPEYALVAVLSGTVLTLLAPVFITWFLR